jgi:hypothetical protein
MEKAKADVNFITVLVSGSKIVFVGFLIYTPFYIS